MKLRSFRGGKNKDPGGRATSETRELVRAHVEMWHPKEPLYVFRVAKTLGLSQGQVEDAFRILNQQGKLTQREHGGMPDYKWLRGPGANPRYWKIQPGWHMGRQTDE